jgi:hypothetical protein
VWFCFNDGFVSVVQDKRDPNKLMVRGRSYQHLQNIFGQSVRIVVTPRNDYRFRVFTNRQEWADIVSKRIHDINYGNFKDSVKEKKLALLYGEFWYLHMIYQEGKGWLKKAIGGR